ncbi:hypothetical protein PRIPAC_74789, partial [Pristionchus pacificus]|uniref:Uncharacterized protein n=1 Tax=Pristionchus pacificus TaxID=54126 RepID=A0A2A6CAC5_PRIPA
QRNEIKITIQILSVLHDRLQRLHSVAPNSDSTHSLRASTNATNDLTLPRSLPSNSSFDIPCISIEQILSAISQLVPKWNMTLSAPKCAVLHLGRLKTRSKYVLNGCVVSPKNEIRDLGVFFNSKLHFAHHIDQITRKARSMCNLMLRSFLTTSSDVLLKAFKIYIRPLLESSTVIWNPTAIGLVNKLESVQREFTMRIFWRSHLSQSSYPQRLEHFKLETLEYRRALNDMYFLFDYAHGFLPCPGYLIVIIYDEPLHLSSQSPKLNCKHGLPQNPTPKSSPEPEYLLLPPYRP